MTEASSHAGGNFFKPLLFFAGFYLIYQPNFWTNSYVPMIITLGIAIICVLALSPYEVLLTIDRLKIFEIGVLLSIIYFAFRALLAGNDPRIFSKYRYYPKCSRIGVVAGSTEKVFSDDN